ncbi:hypothetical protein JZ751_006129 [Albula glossodonta]|uniref:Uncharacterized protein n=1 Tax=Albula glossodonta TaxID=121402 RepID=A0A8T2P7H3_9TELE|nr:hypothetical protein JZ751_006129 [Albula glossodonta]
MDRYRYFIFNQRSTVVLGLVQIGCAGLCVVCGFIDAAFRRDTTLSSTRAPLWAGVKFILSQTVKGANVAVLMACLCSLLVTGLMAYLGCRSLPFCACYDSSTGLELLVPQNDPSPQTEMICTWQGGDDRLFNTPSQPDDRSTEQQDSPPKAPPYTRLV